MLHSRSVETFWQKFHFALYFVSVARVKVHEQVRERIQKLLSDGALEPGHKLPNENDLATTLKVSRTTVRNALKTLEYEGRIERTPGRGTVVREARPERLSGKLAGFTEETRLRGLAPSSQLIEATRMIPSTPVKTLLRLENELVWRIQRVRCADAEPIAVETCYIPCGLLSEEEVASLGSSSLYDLLVQRGRAPVSSDQSIEAALLNAEEAALLKVSPGRPVLRFERLCFDAKGKPLEFAVSTYRGDKHRVYVLLRR